MRKLHLLSTLLLAIFTGGISYAQDFSNKGKDFWVGYGYHQIMSGTNLQDMVLYFAADQNTNVTVTIPGIGYAQNYFVAANTVLTSSPIPKTGLQDARLLTESTIPEKKGIHITSDKPIVAYAHIYNQSVSGATILFPTTTLGKEYFSVNYTNISNSPNSNCWFYVVAADTGTTTVEITPSAATINRPAGIPFLVTLQQGEIYNIMGQVSGNTGVDLTGSKIQSINTGAGCKRIGVFSGSGRISITCNGISSSSDSYMVQAFPKSAWGKKYLTASASGGMDNNIYRVCVTDPSTIVTVNGAPIAVPLQNGFYYELPITPSPMKIEANNPILVAQYFTSTQGNTGCGNAGPGDPEVIYLSPVEQNINKVLWNATPNFAIGSHFFNVIVPNTGTGLSSFRLDGILVSPSLFTVHPQDPAYSYLKQSVGSGQHTIQSDSGFNAIAYGFGSFESYGYNAGTNIKDIYQYISVQNPQATVNFPATCRGTPFYFSMTFPYQPTSIQWQFGPALNAMGIADVNIPAPVPTSTTVVNGKTLYNYQLPTPYVITVAGTYPIRVVATNPTPDGCGGTQEIDFDLQAFDPPLADFNFTTNGCVSSPVSFTDNSNTNGRPVISRHWNFGDANTSALNNPSHTYAAPGAYTVKYSLITDIGCIADTASRVVTINDPPVALFTVAAPYCEGRSVTFTDQSTSPGGATISQWTWDFGDGSPVVVRNTSTNETHTYASAGSYTATLRVVTSSGCQSTLFSFPVTIYPNPVADFNLPVACLPVGAAQFNDLSTVGGGNTITSWAWNFGDAGTSTVQNPSHNYSAPGPFNVSLTVTSNNGCTDTKNQVLNTVYAEPQAAFNSLPEVCIGSLIGFSDASTAPGSTVTGWSWNFGDGSPISTIQNPTHIFSTAGTYTVTLNVTSAAGCQTMNNSATRTVVVKPLPTGSITGAIAVCLNAPSPNVTFTGGTGTAPFTFTYTINGGPVQTVITTSGNSVDVPVPTNTAGTFIYTLTSVKEGSSASCVQSQSGSVTVTVNALPTATITGITTVCLNAASPAITFTGASGSAPYTFTYNINGGPNQTVTTTTGNSATVTVPTTTAGTFTYNLISVQEGSANFCNQAQIGSAVVIVNPLPTASISGDNEVCLNSASPNITFTGGAGSAPYTFTYNINGGPNQTVTTTTGNTVTVPVPTTVAGTFTYNLISVQEGSANLCNQAQIGSAVVIVNPLPTGNFTFTAPSCETRTITFTDASAANAGTINNWQWNFGDPGSGASNTSTLQNPSHTFVAAGTYTVTLTVTTDKGCVSNVYSNPVTINARPKAGFISPEVCLTDPLATFTDTSSVVGGTIVAWEWNFGDPNANAGNPNTSVLQNPTHRYTVVGPYTAQLIVTSNNGCKDTTQQTFIVNGSIPVAGFTVLNPSTLCSNQSVSITDASTVDFGNLVKVEVFWDYLNNPTIKTTDDNPIPGAVYTHSYPEFGTPFTRTFQVRYVAYSGINCVNTTTQTITVLATPTLQFAPIPFACTDKPSFQITQAQLLNGLPGAGVFSGTGVTPTGLFSPSIGAGQYNIRYTYTGTNGCSNYKEQTVDIYTAPAINAGPDKFVLEGGQVTLTPALNVGVPLTYMWTPPTGLDNVTSSFPVASPTDDITYTLTVTTPQGCTASDNVFVKVLKAPIIPNIFSPNGDGVHDRWDIPFLESYPGCTIDVVNRYGQLIFRSVGYTTAWDGRVNGKDVPVGTYYYVIDPKNGRAKVTGYVDIIR